jgi:hypothetical protein
MKSWMTVYNWPVLRCPRLAGFEVSPEAPIWNGRSLLTARIATAVAKGQMYHTTSQPPQLCVTSVVASRMMVLDPMPSLAAYGVDGA